MGDGIHALRFGADGYEDHGLFDMQQDRGQGGDGSASKAIWSGSRPA